MPSSDLKVLPVDLARIVEGMEMQRDEGPLIYVLNTETGKVFDFPSGNDNFDNDADEDDADSDADAGDDRHDAAWLKQASDEVRAAYEAWEIGEEHIEEVPPPETQHAYQLMAEFAETNEDKRLGEELSRAIRGKGAFRRFKDVLLDFPEQREKWFAFEAERKRQWAIDWLESIGIRPESLGEPEKKSERTLPEVVASYAEPVQKLFALGDDYDAVKPKNWPDYRHKYGVGPEHIQELIRLVRDAKYFFNQTDSETDDWKAESFAPIHAWRALGQLGAVESARPMLEMVEKTKYEAAYEEVPYALVLLGTSVLPVATEFLRSQRFDEWTRVAALDALALIAKSHPQTREQVIEEMIAAMRDHSINPTSLNSLLVVQLVELKATQAASVLREAYAAGTVDESMSGMWSDVRKGLGIERHPEDPPDRRRPSFPPAIHQPYHSFSTPSQQPHRNREVQKKREKNKRKQAKKAKRQNRKR